MTIEDNSEWFDEAYAYTARVLLRYMRGSIDLDKGEHEIINRVLLEIGALPEPPKQREPITQQKLRELLLPILKLSGMEWKEEDK